MVAALMWDLLVPLITIKVINCTSGAVLCGIYTVFTLSTIWVGRWLPETKNQLQIQSGTLIQSGTFAVGESFTSKIEYYLMDVVSMTGWRGICHCPLFDSVASNVEVAYYSFSDMPRMTLFAIFATVHTFTRLWHCFMGLQICSPSLCVCTIFVQQSFTQRLHALQKRPALLGRSGLCVPPTVISRVRQRVSELRYYMSSQRVSSLHWPIFFWHFSCALMVYRNFVHGRLYAHGRFS